MIDGKIHHIDRVYVDCQSEKVLISESEAREGVLEVHPHPPYASNDVVRIRIGYVVA
jgi:hypothetical protein